MSLKSWWCQDVSRYRIYFRWSSFHPSSHCCHDESIKYLIYPQAFKWLPQDIVCETLNPPKALGLFSHFKQQKQTHNPLLPNKSCSQVAEWFPTTTWSWQLKSQLEEEQQDISHFTIHETPSLTCIKNWYCIQNKTKKNTVRYCVHLLFLDLSCLFFGGVREVHIALCC